MFTPSFPHVIIAQSKLCQTFVKKTFYKSHLHKNSLLKFYAEKNGYYFFKMHTPHSKPAYLFYDPIISVTQKTQMELQKN